MNLIIAPDDGTSRCGHACVAMAAGVSLDRATEVIGHTKRRGTFTREVVAALWALGISCATRAKRLSKTKPVLPKRALVAICTHKVDGRYRVGHWMLWWDGVMHDPRNEWPDGYRGWTITSYVEIHS